MFLAVLCTLFSLAQAQGINGTNEIDAQCPVDIPGFVHHGNCNLLCRTATWTDIVVFFLGNYIAHAATVTSRPGQSSLISLSTIVTSLLFPGAGVHRGLEAIFSLAKFADTDLQMAARAGALYTVVKVPCKHHEPPTNYHTQGDPTVPAPDRDFEMQSIEAERIVENFTATTVPRVDRGNDDDYADVTRVEPIQPGLHRLGLQSDLLGLRPRREKIGLLASKIHGVCRLPDGYGLVLVPRTATFEEPAIPTLPLHQRLWRSATALFRVEPTPRPAISCSYNLVKILVSLAQLLYAISTLYSTRGDQIAMYGYAAFGLTVAPYAWMSFINLIGNIICPQYNAIFVIESGELDKLQARINAAGDAARELFMVTGTVGRLTPLAEANLWRSHGDTSNFLSLASFCVGAVPIAIVGGLSHFTSGQSALYQRAWTMTWLVFGFFIGSLLKIIIDEVPSRYSEPLPSLYLSAFYMAPAIGGFVVVAQMISDFGVCQLL